jgi:hypothetical protein
MTDSEWDDPPPPIKNLSIDFPIGSSVGLPHEDEDGDFILRLDPPGGYRFGPRFLEEIGDCAFSLGNSWPDTIDMKDFIEEQLKAGWPVDFMFESMDDARACYGRLQEAGVWSAATSP